jgi:ferritin
MAFLPWHYWQGLFRPDDGCRPQPFQTWRAIEAEEEKKHALQIIQFVIDTGARVNIPSVSAADGLQVRRNAIKLSLEHEARVTSQTNAIVSMARAHFIADFNVPSKTDRGTDN